MISVVTVTDKLWKSEVRVTLEMSYLNLAAEKIDNLAGRFVRDFPSGVSRSLRYEVTANVGWTPGFWLGLLWLAHEYTGDRKYRDRAESHVPSFRDRLDRGGSGVETHDLGFLFTLSCTAAYKLTGHEEAKSLALRAADILSRRYFEGGRIIQAWGRLDDVKQRGRIIIDGAMNMPLLFWASEQTGDASFHGIARNHLDQSARYLVREDGSTVHTYFIDPETGEGRFARTHQGVSDDSCWSRGQAWGIYGFSLGYEYTHELRFLDVAKKLTNYFLDRLPADGICYWDMIFEEGAEEEKDSSAAAIAAAGMLALSGHLPTHDLDGARYRRAACQIVNELSTKYLTTSAEEEGLLLHGVCNRPERYGVDEFCIWGDYFYTEALMRLHTAWIPYW